MSPRRGSVLIILSVFIAYANSLCNQFAYDDFVHIAGNEALLGVGTALQYFLQPLFPGNLYRPLPLLHYALLHRLFSWHPFGWHLFLVGVHAVNSLLVYLLLSNLTKRADEQGRALLVACLFAVHPIHTEVVANVSGLPELLAAFFALLSLSGLRKLALAAAGSQRLLLVAWTLFTGLSFMLALFSKESAVVTVMLAPLLLWYLRAWNGRLIAAALSAFAAGLAVYFTFRFLVFGASLFGEIGDISAADNVLFALPALERALNAFCLLGRYALLGFFPLSLSSDYSYRQIEPLFRGDLSNTLVPALQGGVACALLVIAISGLPARRAVSFFGAWFFLAFMATANFFFPIGTIFGERLAYLPSLGLAGLLVAGVARCLGEKYLVYGIAALCLAFTVRTVLRNPVWRNNETLFSDQIVTAPYSSRAHLNYASILAGKGQLKSAFKEAERALELYPENAEAAAFIAHLYRRINMPQKANEWLERARRLNPNLPEWPG